MSPVLQFLWGALTIASSVAGLLFLRFWRDTRDRLFVYFAIAFWTLAVNWILLATIPARDEGTHHAYFVRMAAFVVLAAGILDKNRRR